MEGLERFVHGRGHFELALGAVFDDVHEDGIDAHAVALADALADDLRHVLGSHDAAAHGVVQIVVHIGHAVAQAHDVGLERIAREAGGVVQDAEARLEAEVQAPPLALEPVDDAQALLIVAKARALEDGVQRALSGVAEGRVAEIVAEGDRLGEILVEHERTADRAGEARDLERVRQARAVMIALRLEEDLRFVL